MSAEKIESTVPVAPLLDAAAAKEIAKAIEGKTALLREILNHAVAGKFAGASLAEILRAPVCDGNCGIGCW